MDNILSPQETNCNNCTRRNILLHVPNELPKPPLVNFIEARVGKHEKLFKYLDEHFRNENKIIISGLPGIGKSVNSMQYAYNTDCISRWVNADALIKIHDGFRKLAKALKISQWATSEIHELIEDIKMEVQKLDKTCLIILDNVELYQDIEPFLSINVRFIITSRNKTLSDEIKSVTLEPFSKDEALCYLEHSLKDFGFKNDDVEKALDREIVNGEILAYRVEHLAGFLKHNSKKLIDEILIRFAKCDNHKIEIKLIDKIKTESSTALKILEYCIFLSSSGIKLQIIKELIGLTNDEISSNMKFLSSLSLVSSSSPEMQEIVKHRLTQSLIKRHLNDNEKIQIISKIVQYINQNMPYIEEAPDQTWETAQMYVEHAEEVLKSVKSDTNIIYAPKLLEKVGIYYKNKLFNNKVAIEYLNRSIEMYRRLYNNEVHSDIARTLNNIGLVYRSMGNLEKALEYYNESFEMIKKVYNKESHSHIAVSLNNIGALYKAKGDTGKALEYYNESLEMRKNIYNNEVHPQIAISLNNIGLVYDSIGDSEKALENYNKSLEMYKKIYNNKPHPHIAISLNNIGSTYRSIGDLDKALKYYKESLEMYQEIYIDQAHPEFAVSLNNAGTIIRDPQKALDYYKKSIEMYKNIYNDEPHPDIPVILNNISHVYDTIGVSEKALDYYTESLEMMKTVYQSHPDKAKPLNNTNTIDNISEDSEELVEPSSESKVKNYELIDNIEDHIVASNYVILDDDNIVHTPTSDTGLCMSCCSCFNFNFCSVLKNE